MREYLKHMMIRTPLEKPAKQVQQLIKSQKQNKCAELSEFYAEPLHIERMMKKILNANSNCIDVGCHLGSMLSDILELAPSGRHMAFEVLSYKVAWLKNKFPEVDIREVALGDRSGEVSFYLNTNYSGFSGLRQRQAKGKDCHFEEIVVPGECLDNILPPEYRIDFMKIDVEGGELAVLRGAKQTLQRYQPTLLFECSRTAFSQFDVTAADIFQFFTQELSYSLFFVKDFLEEGEPVSFEEFDRALQYPPKALNFMGVPKVRSSS